MMLGKFLIAMSCAVALRGCDLTVERADQENFTFDGRRAGIESFIQTTAAAFNAPVERTSLNIPNADPTEAFDIHARGVIVSAQPMGDDRCIPRQRGHLTFNQRQYRIDLVYRTSSHRLRELAKRKLLDAAARTGQPLQFFEECD